MFIKVSMVCRSRLGIFYFKESSVFRTRRQVPCEMFISRKRSKDLAEKIVSSVKFDTNPSFKQCFFFNQLIVYQSFYGGLLVFSYFLLQGKFVSAHVGEMFVLKMSKKLKLFAACMFLRHLLRVHYFGLYCSRCLYV